MSYHNIYKKFSKEELGKLVTLQDRFHFLYLHSGYNSKAEFISRKYLSKTSFYKIWNGGMVRDPTLESFARAFGVSFEFLKYGGTEVGKYVTKEKREEKYRLLRFERVVNDVIQDEKCTMIDFSIVEEYIRGKGDSCATMFLYVIMILRKLEEEMGDNK